MAIETEIKEEVEILEVQEESLDNTTGEEDMSSSHNIGSQTVFENPQNIEQQNALNRAMNNNCAAMKDKLAARRERLSKMTSRAKRRSDRISS